MAKYSTALIRETKYISFMLLGLSAVMETVFLILAQWDYKVFLGNILSVSTMILNFFMMGISVEKAILLGKGRAKKIIWASQSIRNVLIFGVVAIGVVLPVFNTVSVIIPVFFPRIALVLRPYFNIKERDAV